MLCPSGLGVWPGFWLDGITSVNRKRTTNSVEIDVLEAFGVDMTIAHQHVHVWSPGGKHVGGASLNKSQIHRQNTERICFI